MSQPTVPSPIEASTLHGLAEALGAGVLGTVVDTLLSTSPAICEDIARAHAAGEAVPLRAAAHRLKGATANLGAARLPALCELLERVAATGDLGAAAPLVEAVRAEYRRVHAALAASPYAARGGS